jgi:hypothetical protein
MLSVIPHRRRSSTPLSAMAHALPGLPSLPGLPARDGHSHMRIVAAASATAGLAVGTAAGAVIFSGRGHHGHGEQAPEQVSGSAQEE